METDQEPVFVPHTDLSADALRGVIESFVLREGTDYGEREFSLEEKLSHVYRQLERGEAQIVFDPQTETIDILSTRSGGGSGGSLKQAPARSVGPSAAQRPSPRSKPE